MSLNCKRSASVVVFHPNVVTCLLHFIFKCKKSPFDVCCDLKCFVLIITFNRNDFGNIWRICDLDPLLVMGKQSKIVVFGSDDNECLSALASSRKVC